MTSSGIRYFEQDQNTNLLKINCRLLLKITINAVQFTGRLKKYMNTFQIIFITAIKLQPCGSR